MRYQVLRRRRGRRTEEEAAERRAPGGCGSNLTKIKI
jgi:hypothetical protein